LAIPVLLILAVLWAAVLIPPLFRGRLERRHGDSIGDFNFRLSTIGKMGGYAPNRREPPVVFRTPGASVRPIGPALGRPTGPSRAQRRRRDVLLGLAGAVGASVLLALATGMLLVWVVQILADVLLGAYLVLLVRMHSVGHDRQRKLRFLPPPAAPELALRRTASS
jgi:hypothetical protein